MNKYLHITTCVCFIDLFLRSKYAAV